MELIEKMDPVLFAIVQAPTDTYVDSLMDLRLANAKGDDTAIKAAKGKEEREQQQMLVTLNAYKQALQAKQAEAVKARP